MEEEHNTADPLQLVDSVKVMSEKVTALQKEVNHLAYLTKELQSLDTARKDGDTGLLNVQTETGQYFKLDGSMKEEYLRFGDRISDTMRDFFAQQIADTYKRIEDKKAAL